jgi:hypothetical protein
LSRSSSVDPGNQRHRPQHTCVAEVPWVWRDQLSAPDPQSSRFFASFGSLCHLHFPADFPAICLVLLVLAVLFVLVVF